MSDSADLQPFWRRKRLDEMSDSEWESLCDGCGKCCLYKLEDSDSGELLHTNVACYLLDLSSCRCGNYPERQRLVPDCLKLDPELIRSLPWLPRTCAYRLLAAGDELPDWHPLISGTPETVHRAGVSVSSWAVSEEHIRKLDEHIIDWHP